MHCYDTERRSVQTGRRRGVKTLLATREKIVSSGFQAGFGLNGLEPRNSKIQYSTTSLCDESFSPRLRVKIKFDVRKTFGFFHGNLIPGRRDARVENHSRESWQRKSPTLLNARCRSMLFHPPQSQPAVCFAAAAAGKWRTR